MINNTDYMLKSCIGLLLLAVMTAAGAQSVIVAEDVNARDETPEYGMNRKHYTHMFLGVLFAVGPPEQPGAEVIYGRSRTLEYGYRYKRKLSNTFSLGSEITGRRHAYHIKQSESKTVPDTIVRDREKLVFLEAGAAVYKRVNFGQRGNYIGRFADVGGYASWIFHTRHVLWYEEDGVSLKVRKTGMQYPANFDYGLIARIGFNNILIKGTYRMSGLFKDSSNMPEFPRYAIGLELGLHPS